MTATGFLDLPPEIRNTIYHLVLCEYRINLTSGDIPSGRPPTLTVHGKPLALQAVCKTIRKETSVIVPIPVVSISDCLSSEIRTIRVPQSYLHWTRRLVIDLYVASNTDLSWFVTSMPHLLEVEMHLPIDYFRVTDITNSFVGVPAIRDIRECAYEIENVPEGTQVSVRDGELLAELEFVRDRWTEVIGKWPTEPRIIVRRPGVYYRRLDLRNERLECICVTELAFSIFPIRLTSLKKVLSATESVKFSSFYKIEALVEPLWDFNGVELEPKMQLSGA